MFIMFTYFPKVVKHYRKLVQKEDQDLFMILLLDKFNLGVMGLFVCFAFIWKRKGFNPKAFFERNQKFEEVTE